MSPYIFMEKNGIHIIDLHKTEGKLKEASSAMKQIAKSGRKILFVATKKQAKDIVAEKVKAINMPYVTERWPGGMLTNFPTIRKAVKKMAAIDKMSADGTFDTLSKRERLQITRQRAKLEKNLGSIADLTRLPAAMFIVDVHKEYIAVREANRLNIPVFAMVDTNSDPRQIEFPIPANDDASKSISLIINYVCDAVAEGLNERKMEKEKEDKEQKDTKAAGKKAKTEEPQSAQGGESKGRPRTGGKAAAKPEVKAEKKEAESAETQSKPKTSDKVEEKVGKKAEVKAEEKAEEKAEATQEAESAETQSKPEAAGSAEAGAAEKAESDTGEVKAEEETAGAAATEEKKESK